MSWTENTLVPSPCWGDGVTYSTWALGTQYGVLIAADVLWRSIVLVCPDYLPRIPLENACAAAPRVHDARLQEDCLVLDQNVLYTYYIGGDGRVYLQDYDWDDFWYKPHDQ